MRKLVGGGLASAVALGASLALAAPGGAGVAPLEASIDPDTVEPGEPAVVTSVDPCVDPGDGEGAGVLSIAVFAPDGVPDTFDWETDEEGNWGLNYWVGDGDSPGEYLVAATCTSPDGSLKTSYEALTFTVAPRRMVDEELEMTISPSMPAVAAPGSTVTVRSVDPCPGHRTNRELVWQLWSIDVENAELDQLVRQDVGSLDGAGNWTTSFAAPGEDEYGFFAFCVRQDETDESGIAFTGIYVPVPLLVDDVGTPAGPTPPDVLPDPPTPHVDLGGGSAAPAIAVSGRPTFTG